MTTLREDWVREGICTNVVDGDTIDVEIDQGFHDRKLIRLRLRGIDTWENRGDNREKGLTATRALRELVEGKEVVVRTHKSGKYGRWLADVEIEVGVEPFGTRVIDIATWLRGHGHEKVKEK